MAARAARGAGPSEVDAAQPVAYRWWVAGALIIAACGPSLDAFPLTTSGTPLTWDRHAVGSRWAGIVLGLRRIERSLSASPGEPPAAGPQPMPRVAPVA